MGFLLARVGFVLTLGLLWPLDPPLGTVAEHILDFRECLQKLLYGADPALGKNEYPAERSLEYAHQEVRMFSAPSPRLVEKEAKNVECRIGFEVEAYEEKFCLWCGQYSLPPTTHHADAF